MAGKLLKDIFYQRNKIMKTLSEIDKKLADDLILRSETALKFNDLSKKEKIAFLTSALARLDQHFKDGEYKDFQYPCLIPLEDINDAGLGNYAQRFVKAISILRMIKPKSIFYGWHHVSGSAYQYYERIDGEIFISYYSEGHPEKEFKHKWDLLTERPSEYLKQLYLLPITHSAIEDGRKVIKRHFLLKK
jgi:hypothetical protein